MSHADDRSTAADTSGDRVPAGASARTSDRPDSLPRAIVIGVGDELLLGRTVDTNAAWLGRELAEMGLPMTRHLVVGDAPEEIEEGIRWGLASAEVVLVTGGLGPTSDDRTRPAAARALGRSLYRDDALAAELLGWSRGLGRPSPSAAFMAQAEVPEGARIIENKLGSAPALVLEAGHDARGEGQEAASRGKLRAGAGGAGKGARQRILVLLPGVPYEMKGLFQDAIAPLLRERFGPVLRPVRFRALHTAGIAESVLAERIAHVLPAGSDPVSVAFLPRLGGVEIRLTARESAVSGEAERWLLDVENEVAPLLEPYRFQAESGEVVDAVAAAALAGGMRIAVAESCTGGLLGKSLTDRGGASGYFAGGVIAYADAVKVRELGVDADVLRRYGAVSEETARAMAVGVARRFGVDVGMAITGIAGPDGGTEEKPVGTVWYAISVGEEVEARGQRFPGGRSEIRERSVQAVLALLLRRMKQTETRNRANR